MTMFLISENLIQQLEAPQTDTTLDSLWYKKWELLQHKLDLQNSIVVLNLNKGSSNLPMELIFWAGLPSGANFNLARLLNKMQKISTFSVEMAPSSQDIPVSAEHLAAVLLQHLQQISN